jgi:hypothetical protein
MDDYVKPEPAPQTGKDDVWLKVIKQMAKRRKQGIRNYGTPLKTHNGRRALVDAFQESLDMAVYLYQEILERRDIELEKDTMTAQFKIERRELQEQIESEKEKVRALQMILGDDREKFLSDNTTRDIICRYLIGENRRLESENEELKARLRCQL